MIGEDVTKIAAFFDLQYGRHVRYWWAGDNRYSLDPSDHTWFNAEVLRAVSKRPRGRALDIGAGEGADAIRLAKLGYEVDVIEVSPVACRKIERFANRENVHLDIRNESIDQAVLFRRYDVVLMNGVLHYVADKDAVLKKIRAASALRATHIVSLFSNASTMPREHLVIPVYPDREGGVTEQFYRRSYASLDLRYERSRPEKSHPGFSAHTHSHIKFIAHLADSAEPK